MSHDSGDSLSTRWPTPVTSLLALGWTAAVMLVFILGYEAGMRPVFFVEILRASLPAVWIGQYFGSFWLHRLGDLAWCMAVAATAFAVGVVLTSRLAREHNLLTGLFALVAGLWIMAVGVLLIGAVSVTNVGWIFALAALWLLPAPRSYFRRTGRSDWDCWMKVLFMFIVTAALLNLLAAVLPAFEYDELEYHLGAPSEYIKAGRIVFLPHNFYSNMPQLTEMLYLLGLVTRSDIAAKLLHWSFGLLSAVAIFAVATRLWSRRIGITAAALFYCLPFVQDLSQTARIDLATTFFATLAFGAVLLATDGDRWIWLAGVAAGAAVATKWTAIPVVLMPAGVFVLLARRSLWSVSGFGLLAVLMVVPWLLKNWILAGNPVYPLWATSEHWSVAQAALFAEKHYATFDAAGWRAFGERVSQYSFVENGASPVLLMTAPLALLATGNRRLRWAGVLFLAAYVGWYGLTFRPWRFLMPAFPLAAALGACGLAAAGRWCRPIVVAILVWGFMWMGSTLLVDTEDERRQPPQVSALNLVLGQLPEEEFLARLGHGVFESIVWMNHHLPADARVLYIGEARTYLARHPVVWSTAFDQHPVLRGVAGVTHVYINFSEWERLRTHYNYLLDLDGQAFRSYLGEHGRIVHEHDRSKVYELVP